MREMSRVLLSCCWFLPACDASRSDAGVSDACGPITLTAALVGALAKRTALMAEVAAQKADFALIFDSEQELSVLKAAGANAWSAQSWAPSLLFAQVLADCAKHEQEAHLQAAVDAADATGGDATMTSSYESLDDLREVLAQLNLDIFAGWEAVSLPGGEWEQVGCQCARTGLATQMISQFQRAAIGGCSDSVYSEMLTWVLLSASASCRV